MSKTEKQTISAPEYQITGVEIDNKDIVTIAFQETFLVAPKDPEGESQERTNSYVMTSDFGPDKEFIDALLSLRKYGMMMTEFNDKDMPLRNSMKVLGMKITGSIEKENARVSFVLGKYVKRTGKTIAINTGQSVLFKTADDGKSIDDVEQMLKGVKKVIDEAWLFIKGKNAVKAQISFRFAS